MQLSAKFQTATTK